MNKVVSLVRPKSGFSVLAHVLLVILLPVVIFSLVRIQLVSLALIIVLLSKWRVFTVKMRYWPALLRANAVDLIVGISFLTFMAINPDALILQIGFAGLYAVWLLLIKPHSDSIRVVLQAGIAQLLGLIALFSAWDNAPLLALAAGSWAVCYFAAYHFFTEFEEPKRAIFALMWGYFAATCSWILGHWLLFYLSVAQPVLILSIAGYGLAALYYLTKNGKMVSVLAKRQFVFVMVALLIAVVVFSDWSQPTL